MSIRTNKAAVPDDPARRRILAGAALAVGGLVLGKSEAYANADDPISHSAESIHQEVAFTASPKRIYEALTDATKFQRVVELSNAMKMHIPAGAPTAQISTEVGGAFSMFGGIIVGRHIELLPNQRIVQAWRPVYWNPGVYSIVKFELAESSSGTRLTLDHRGFPDGDAQHLLTGWNENYWEPLRKFLAQP
ncbi:MAG: SRPBCC domain-containing protein [Candidatus Acidiferrales bacterium]